MDDDKYNVEEEKESSNGWLGTYADLVTLLMCFFVLLYSMSTIDDQKIRKAITSLNSMGIISQQGNITTDPNKNVIDTNVKIMNEQSKKIIEEQSKKMDKLYSEVKEFINKKKLGGYVNVENQFDGVLIRFKDDILYDIGKAELKPVAKATLTPLSDILKKYNNKIKIEGHTDNIPIKNNKYESNWELSTSRAISVVKFFSSELPSDKQIPQQNFEVAGYGEYRPIAPNNTEQNRQKNRRIEIFILK